MRYVVFGAGAVGGVVGGLLHRAGHEVALIARGQHLAAIRQNGLRLVSPVGETVEQIPAAARPAEIDWRPDDVVLLAVKSDATVQAVLDLAAAAPRTITVVSLQNGVSNESTVLRWFERVYGVCVMAPTAHLEPGLVQAHCHPTPAILDVGRYPTGSDAMAVQVAAAFVTAGIESVPRPDIMRWKYRKLMMNLGNAVQAVCAPGGDRDELLALIREEGERVLSAAGVALVSEAEDRERRGDILQVVEVPGRPRSGGSSWQSLQRRTGAIETDYLNGEIIWLARCHGLDAPANEVIQRAALRHAREGLPPGVVPAADLLRPLHSA